MDKTSLHSFLTSISLTEKQADEIVREYPNIMDICEQGKIHELDLSRLHGIGPYIIKVIQRKIEENLPLSGISQAFGGMISLRVAKELKEKYKSLTQIINQMNKNPYKCICSLQSISFKTADKILLKMSGQKMFTSDGQSMFGLPLNFINSKDRCVQAAIFLLSQNELSGNTNMKIPALKKEIRKLAPECLSHLEEILTPGSCPQEIHIDESTKLASRAETYFTEKRFQNIF